MAKRTYNNEEPPNNIGGCFLLYGITGVGKTKSLRTLPDPILDYVTEPRDPRRVLSDLISVQKKWDFREFDAFDEYMEDLSSVVEQYMKGERPFKSVAFDSLGFIQGQFKLDFEDDRFDMSLSEKKRDDNLVDRFRIEKQDWGGLGSMMKRLTILLNKLSKFGVIVVATAIENEDPKYDRDLNIGPSFMGKDFPQALHGYFDFIGRVTPKKGDNPFPPDVSFISDGAFMAKLCSDKLRQKLVSKGTTKMPLDFNIILRNI
jgi:hypothetical protein